MTAISAAVNAILKPIRRQLAMMVARGVIQLVNNGTGVQELQITVLVGETLGGVENFQNYGFTSVPLAGMESLVLCIGGNRDHPISVATADRQYRPRDWAAGETGVYDHLGKFVRLRADGTLEISAPTILLKSDDVRLGDSGGAPVARIGDRVNVGGGSSAGLWPIVEGSDKVTSD